MKKVIVLTQETTDSHDHFVQGVFTTMDLAIQRVVDVVNGNATDDEDEWLISFDSVKQDMADNMYESGCDVFRFIEEEIDEKLSIKSI